MSTMFRFVLFLLLFLSASQTWGVSVSAHQYDVKSVIFAVDAYVYDAPLNLRTCDNQCIESKAQDVNKGHFLAFVSDFLATKSVTKRPSGFRKQTVQDAWDKAAPGSKPGTKACPTCGKDVTVAPGKGRRDWDVDHQPAWSKRDLPSTRKEVLDNYNTGTRLECPGCNRSRGAGPLE